MKKFYNVGLAVNNPNFSIVIPSLCNAKCQFCFWENKCDLTEEQYTQKLHKTLSELPDDFTQCSITGGEPTMYGHLPSLLERVRERFDKIVLTSNGFNINDSHLEHIDHLNISRHRIDDEENFNVFRTRSVPDTASLTEICQLANELGVDVTLNCVLPIDFMDVNYIYDYIDFAKRVGANAVCFRKEHSDIELLPVEEKIKNKIYYDHSCGVCRVREQFINGIKVTWRYSVLEPSLGLNQVYELILHQDGVLTMDWEANEPIDLTPQTYLRTRSVSFAASCGGSYYTNPDPEPRRVYASCSTSGC